MEVRPRGSIQRQRRRSLWILLTGLLLLAGCRSARWHSPRPTSALRPEIPPRTELALAEQSYAQARRLEAEGQEACTDWYFLAATQACVSLSGPPADSRTGRAVELYNSALTQMLTTAQRAGRFDPQRGLEIRVHEGRLIVPIRYHGFPWAPADFQKLVPVGDYADKSLSRYHRRPGLGAPLVVLRQNPQPPPLMAREGIFAATALLRPADGWASATSTPANLTPFFTLDFYDPLRLHLIEPADAPVRLAADVTAPIAYRLQLEPNDALSRFIQPGATRAGEGLRMIEPYQPGKIPLIFVHGLLSDPLTWADLGNDLRAQPWVTDQFQLWVFEYDTGEQFLRSATSLRRQLATVQATLDPHGRDAALARMVLVGHSMGGLLSKLQVTYSGDKLWSSVARAPLGSIRASDDARRLLAEMFYFEPTPSVSRVIFIGTPHRGSAWARRWVGRLGANLVREPDDRRREQQQLMRDNPGVFSEEVRRRIPASIDLLEPSSPLLNAIADLPIRPEVPLHSIIGDYRWMLAGGRGDGVVPVQSAREPRAQSELRVHARHTEIHHKPESVSEVLRILRQHLTELKLSDFADFRRLGRK